MEKTLDIKKSDYAAIEEAFIRRENGELIMSQGAHIRKIACDSLDAIKVRLGIKGPLGIRWGEREVYEVVSDDKPEGN